MSILCCSLSPAGLYVGQPQMQFHPQGFAAGMGGAVPPTTVMGGGAMMAMPNGGYIGVQQQQQQQGGVPANQGQSLYGVQPGQQAGQWAVGQVSVLGALFALVYLRFMS